VLTPQVAHPVGAVERVHLERRRVDEQPRPDEPLVKLMVAQDVADVLAEEALDALAELLHAVDVGLRHAPGPVGRVGRPRREPLDLLLRLEVPRDVGDEVADRREAAHRLDGDRLVERQVGEPRHAHELRRAVDLRRAGAALAGLAVPAHGQVVGGLGLDLVHGVEHHHPSLTSVE
jgi:hypothetical protein